MSKAFTRESDDLPDPPPLPRQAPVLPPGAKNYLTPGGARRLRDELDRLVHVDRPAASTCSDPNSGPDRLQAIDQRIRYLELTLRSAVVVDPLPQGEDRIRFGATVTVRERGGAESQYRIVGVDETDIDRGWVSWLSPIARALINHRCGESVRFRFPSGEEDLAIVKVEYE